MTVFVCLANAQLPRIMFHREASNGRQNEFHNRSEP